MVSNFDLGNQTNLQFSKESRKLLEIGEKTFTNDKFEKLLPSFQIKEK